MTSPNTPLEAKPAVDTVALLQGAPTPGPAAPARGGWHSLLTSKTFYINTAALVLACIPPVTDWIVANGIESAAILGALNILAKILTALTASREQKQNHADALESNLPQRENAEKETPPADAAAPPSSIGGTGGDISRTLSIALLLTLLPVLLVSCNTGNPGQGRLTFEQRTPTGEITITVEHYKNK